MHNLINIEVLADIWEEEQNFFYQQNLNTMKKSKVKAKKVKAVAKKKRVTIKDKYESMYKIVVSYSESLMQDVYSVVYRKKELKRFINEKLAKNYIQQEVLLRLGEHTLNTAKKSRELNKELAMEFE